MSSSFANCSSGVVVGSIVGAIAMVFLITCTQCKKSRQNSNFTWNVYRGDDQTIDDYYESVVRGNFKCNIYIYMERERQILPLTESGGQ